jgi:thiol-disulfide isomerase/thioredoxin
MIRLEEMGKIAGIIVATLSGLSGISHEISAWGGRGSFPLVLILLGLRAGLAADGPATPPTASIQVLDLDGRSTDPFSKTESKATVFIFLSVDCPVCNSYAPEIRRLAEEFEPKGVSFDLVYPNGDESARAVRKHLKHYASKLTVLRDPRHELVKAAQVQTTPEAAVFVPGKGLVYRGRIDDRYVQLGKTRPHATERDLRDAVVAVLSDRPIPRPITRAVGCYIPDPP